MYELPATALLFSESHKNKSGLSYTRDLKLFVVQHLQIHRLPFVGKTYVLKMFQMCVLNRSFAKQTINTLSSLNTCNFNSMSQWSYKSTKAPYVTTLNRKKDLNFHIFTLTVSSQQKWLWILLDDDEEEAIYEFTETLFTLCTFNTHDLMDNKSVLQSPPSGMASLSADSFLFFWPCNICDRFLHTQLYC